MPCGCLAGLYEARNGAIVTLLDVRGRGCDDQSHRVDARLDACVAAATSGSTVAPSPGLFGRVW